MSNNNQKNNQQLTHALKVVQTQIVTLNTRIRAAAPADRAPLEEELRALMASIGMEYIRNPDLDILDADPTATIDSRGTVGGAMLSALSTRTEQLASDNNVDTTKAAADFQSTQAPSLWARFTGFLSNHKKMIIGGVAAVIAAGGALFYYNSTQASTSSGVATGIEVVSPDVVIEAPAGESIFSTVGGYIVRAASAVKGYAVRTWNWVVNLFSKTKEAAADVVAQTEVPAAA